MGNYRQIQRRYDFEHFGCYVVRFQKERHWINDVFNRILIETIELVVNKLFKLVLHIIIIVYTSI